MAGILTQETFGSPFVVLPADRFADDFADGVIDNDKWPPGLREGEASEQAAATFPTGAYGVNLPPLFLGSGGQNTSVYAKIAAKGFTAVRMVLYWSDLEPSRGTYARLPELDAQIAAARAANLAVVLDCVHCFGSNGMAYFPSWTAGTGDSVDTISAHAKGFLTGLAQRYRGSAAFDLVNEPYRWPLDPTGVLRMYNDLIVAIRAVNASDVILIEPTYGDTLPVGIDWTVMPVANRANVVWSVHDYYAGGAGNGYNANGSQASRDHFTWAYNDPTTPFTGYNPANAPDLATHCQAMNAAVGGRFPIWVGECGIDESSANHAQYVIDKMAAFNQRGWWRCWWEYWTGTGFSSATHSDGAWRTDVGPVFTGLPVASLKAGTLSLPAVPGLRSAVGSRPLGMPNSSVVVAWDQVATSGTNKAQMMLFDQQAGQQASLTWRLGGVDVAYTDNNTVNQSASFPGLTALYGRFRMVGGTLYLETSNDGLAWTTRAQWAGSGAFGAAELLLACSCASGETTPGTTFVATVGAVGRAVSVPTVAIPGKFGVPSLTGPQTLSSPGVVSRETTGQLLCRGGETFPALDNANPIYSPSDDLNGSARPSGPSYDLGAFEMFSTLQRISPAMLSSAEVTGTPGVAVQGRVLLDGLASLGATGTPTVTGGDATLRNIVPSGIPSPPVYAGKPVVQKRNAPVLAEPIRAEWTFVLTDLSGARLGVLVGATNRQVTLPLNGIPTVTFAVPMTHRHADTLINDNVLLKAYRKPVRGGTPRLVFIGENSSAQEDPSATGGDMTVTFSGPFWRLQRRMVGIDWDLDGHGIGWVYGDSLNQRDLGEAAQALLAAANAEAPTGVVAGQTTASTVGYVGPYSFKKVGEAIAEMSALLGGFDFQIRPQEPTGSWPNVTIGKLDTLGTLGTDRPDAVFEYGTGRRNLTKYGRVMDKAGKANVVFVQPPSYPDANEFGDTPAVAFATTSIQTTGRYEDLATGGDVSAYFMRDAIARENVRVRGGLRNQFSIDPVPGAIPDALDDFEVGDTVTVRAYSGGEWRMNGVARIYQLTFAVGDAGDEQVTASLIPDAGGAT